MCFSTFHWVYIWATQNFWSLIPQTPNLRLDQNVKVHHVLGAYRDIWPRLRSPEDKHFTYTKASVGCFWGSANVIKRP